MENIDCSDGYGLTYGKLSNKLNIGLDFIGNLVDVAVVKRIIAFDATIDDRM
jgi:hypothetical protein